MQRTQKSESCYLRREMITRRQTIALNKSDIVLPLVTDKGKRRHTINGTLSDVVAFSALKQELLRQPSNDSIPNNTVPATGKRKQQQTTDNEIAPAPAAKKRKQQRTNIETVYPAATERSKQSRIGTSAKPEKTENQKVPEKWKMKKSKSDVNCLSLQSGLEKTKTSVKSTKPKKTENQKVPEKWKRKNSKSDVNCLSLQPGLVKTKTSVKSAKPKKTENQKVSEKWNRKNSKSDVNCLSLQPGLVKTKTSVKRETSRHSKIKEDHGGHRIEDKLIRAVQESCWQALKDIFNECESSKQENWENLSTMALHTAAQMGNKYILQHLLTYGVDVNTGVKTTALHVASTNRYPDVVRQLVEKGADVTSVDGSGTSVLLSAVQASCGQEVLNLLILHGADVDRQNNEGISPAMVCVEKYDFDTLHILIACGADLQLKDVKGNTAFNMATERNMGQVLQLMNLNQHRSAKYLLHEAVKVGCARSVDIFLCCAFTEVDFGEVTPLASALSCGKEVNFDIVNSLLQGGADIEKLSEEGMPLLCLAAGSGQLDVTKLLVAYGAKVNEVCRIDNMSPLMLAAFRGHSEVVDFLISHELSNNFDNNYERSLSYAIQENHVECVKLLMPWVKAYGLRQYLQETVANNRSGILKILLQNLGGEKLEVDLLFTALEEECAETVKLLIGHDGIDVNELSQIHGETPLMCARNETLALLLVEKGALVNKQSPIMERSALMVAAMKGRTDVVAVLLKHDADPNLSDSQGCSALTLAILGDHSETALMLILNGADVNHINSRGHSPLMLAAQRGLVPVVQALVDKGVDINLTVVQCGSSALMYAAMNSVQSIVEILLNAGADVNLEDKSENTALSLTSSGEIAGMLVRAGAEVNHVNNEGNTPLMLAVCTDQVCEKFPLVKSLIGHGAFIYLPNTEESSLSLLLETPNFCEDDFACLKEILSARAISVCPAHHSNCALMKMVLLNDRKFVEILVESGMRPTVVCLNYLFKKKCFMECTYHLLKSLNVHSMSPMSMALLCGNLEIARYFSGNLFWSTFDLNLYRHTGFKSVLQKFGHLHCIDYLDGVLSPPLPLCQLAFVTASMGLQQGLSCEDVSTSTGLPPTLTEKLLFKTGTEKLEHTCSNPAVLCHGLLQIPQRYETPSELPAD